MKTRGLKIVLNSDGVLKTRKVVKESKETQIQRIYANKIYKVLSNTLNSKILNSSENDTVGDDTGTIYNRNDTFESQLNRNTDTNDSSLDVTTEMERLNKIIKEKFEGNYESYIKHISAIIANRCYREYMDNPRMLKRKLFELYSNIKRENNVELRLKIIFKKITINELIMSDVVELAPENVKNIRKKQVEHHYARNVILPSDLDGNGSVMNNDNSTSSGVVNTTSSSSTSSSHKDKDNNNADCTDNTYDYDTDMDDNPKPDITNYKYEVIHQNIIDKLNRLPNFLRKPFLDNMNIANKRIRLLFNRSSILNKV